SSATLPTQCRSSRSPMASRHPPGSRLARGDLVLWPRWLSCHRRGLLGALGGALAPVGRQRMGRLTHSLWRIPRAMSVGVGGSWKGGTEGLGRAVVVRLEICFLCYPFADVWAVLGWRVLFGGWG